LATGYLHRSGTNILDSNNNIVKLRGIWTACYTYTSPAWSGWVTQQTINTLAQDGCNFFKVDAIPWGYMELTQGNYTGNGILTIMDQLAAWCAAKGMYFTLRFNNFEGEDYGITGGPGVTWPSYLHSSDAATTFDAGFYSGTGSNRNTAYDDARTDFSNMLTFLANRYKNNPYFLIGIQNEPNGYQTGITTPANYAAVISAFYSAIYATGYNNLVLVEHPFCNYGTTPVDITGANVVWEGDNYVQPAGSATVAAWEASTTSYFINPYVVGLGRPFIISEWGILNASWVNAPPFDQTDTQAMINWINSQNLAGSLWDSLDDLASPIGYWGRFSSSDTTLVLQTIFQGAVSGGGGTGPTIPFQDNFANLNNWTLIDGTWTLISGGVQGTSSTGEALMVAGNPAWTDYSIASPITIAAAAEASIVFRYQNSTNFYWAGLGLWGHQYSISKVVNGTYSELISSGLQSANPAGTYQLQVIVSGSNIELYVNGVLALTVTDTSLTSGEIGLRTVNSTMKAASVNVTTPITPTYFVNWTITPTSGNLPFTISFSGYLSRFSNTPDAGTIINGETIQIQTQAPGSSTWVNTGISETTGTGTSGNGYFSGTWKLTEPGIYPGAWQFRAYYAGNSTKYLFGCDSKTRKRDLSRVNALIL